jgi:hypothetical protein
MAERMFVKPGMSADGQPFVSPNPATGRPLSVDGEWVDLDRTTRRRLRDGDWIEATQPTRIPSDEAPAVVTEEEPA